jgi:hypothetical protein
MLRISKLLFPVSSLQKDDYANSLRSYYMKKVELKEKETGQSEANKGKSERERG